MQPFNPTLLSVFHLLRNLLYPFSTLWISSSLSLLALSHQHLNGLNFFFMRISLDPMDPSGRLLEKQESLLTLSLSSPHCLSLCSPCNLAYTPWPAEPSPVKVAKDFFIKIVFFHSFQALSDTDDHSFLLESPLLFWVGSSLVSSATPT